MLEECLKFLANLFCDYYKCLRMLRNPYECRCESYERVANEITTRRMRSLFAHTHCRCFSLPFICNLFPIIMLLIVRILSLYYENINTNASESLQTSYDHNKCVAIDKNGLRLLPNMLRICLFTNFRTKFLKFAKPRERPRMLTITNECQTITMRPLRFVSELPRYYVNEPKCKSSMMKAYESLTITLRSLRNDCEWHL